MPKIYFKSSVKIPKNLLTIVPENKFFLFFAKIMKKKKSKKIEKYRKFAYNRPEKNAFSKFFQKRWRWGDRGILRHNFEISSKIRGAPFFYSLQKCSCWELRKKQKKVFKKMGKSSTFFHVLLVTSSGLHLFKNLLMYAWGKSRVLNRMKQLSTLYLIVFPLFGHVWNSMAGEPKKKERRFCFAKRR